MTIGFRNSVHLQVLSVDNLFPVVKMMLFNLRLFSTMKMRLQADILDLISNSGILHEKHVKKSAVTGT